MKYRWRTDLNWLCGASLSFWAGLLRENHVSPAYAHRAAQIGLLSTYNSVLQRYDAVRSGRDFSGVHVPAPLFVLGHWRSGTTFLLDLLATDPARATPNTFQVTNPRTFLSTERVSARLFRGLVPNRRVQDDVPLGFDTPEEDEYAVALLSGCSPYLGRSFPDRLAHYERFLTLRDATDAERARFHAAMREFMQRLTVHYQRPLVLKSPAHTARVRWLLEWFPDARFVHIHRHPYEVFASTRRLYDTVDWFWTLQERRGDHDAVILRQYGALHSAWLEDRGRIPAGRLYELPYDALAADPIGALRQVYTALDLGALPVAPAEAWLARVRGHQNNVLPPLSEGDKERVRAVAAPMMATYGYRS